MLCHAIRTIINRKRNKKLNNKIIKENKNKNRNVVKIKFLFELFYEYLNVATTDGWINRRLTTNHRRRMMDADANADTADDNINNHHKQKGKMFV